MSQNCSIKENRFGWNSCRRKFVPFDVNFAGLKIKSDFSTVSKRILHKKLILFYLKIHRANCPKVWIRSGFVDQLQIRPLALLNAIHRPLTCLQLKLKGNNLKLIASHPKAVPTQVPWAESKVLELEHLNVNLVTTREKLSLNISLAELKMFEGCRETHDDWHVYLMTMR